MATSFGTSLACLPRVSRSERIKEEFGLLKLLFAIAVAVDVSLLAWLAQNYRTADVILTVAGGVVAVVDTVIAGTILLRMLRRLEELEKE